LQSDDTQLSARVNGDHAVVARRSVHAMPSKGGWTLLLSNPTPTASTKGNDIAATILADHQGATLIEAGEVWTYPFAIADAASDALEAVDDLKATLPGKIAAINFDAGAKVQKGDVLVVLEAMKMEHSLTASRAGIIGAVLAGVGKQVRAGEVLVRLVPAEGET
jgi:3-methylcrotonyl-CoA carboxylase alpha subunit